MKTTKTVTATGFAMLHDGPETFNAYRIVEKIAIGDQEIELSPDIPEAPKDTEEERYPKVWVGTIEATSDAKPGEIVVITRDKGNELFDPLESSVMIAYYGTIYELRNW